MKIKALVSFSGDLSMHRGQVAECSDEAILQDLLKANYIEEVKEETKEAKTEKPKKGVKPDESK